MTTLLSSYLESSPSNKCSASQLPWRAWRPFQVATRIWIQTTSMYLMEPELLQFVRMHDVPLLLKTVPSGR